MNVVPLQHTGNSSKFQITTAKSNFILAFSFTLRTKIWQLSDADEELKAAQQIAEAIVGRHDPKLPFKSTYALGEHNTEPTLQATVKYLHRTAI
jgi:hypothetical protein